MDFVLSDEIADRGIRNHHFKSKSTPGPIGSREQSLTENPLQHEGELLTNLRLLIGGEHVHDPVDGLNRRVCMQSGESQVTRLSYGQSRFNRFQIPELANEADIRILPEDVLQRVLERGRIGTDFPLIDHTALVIVEIFDRVLNGHDVFVSFPVDLIDDRRQGRGLARTRRACDQNQPARLPSQILDDLRKAEFLKSLDLKGNRAKNTQPNL